MKLKKYAFTTLFSLALILGLTLGGDVFAQAKDPLGLGYAEASGLTNTDVRFTIARIINVSLSILGTIVVVIILYAGFEWMTAGGSEDKVSSAKQRIGYAVVGLAIILSAYAISNFVVTNLYKATTSIDYVQ